VPIPSNLRPHAERWRKITVMGPVEYHGRLIAKERKGFARARELAGLGEDVTPHILKHTCITWMQRGVPIWEVAGFSGTSEKIIRSVYGHHHPEHLSAAKQRFRGRRLGEAMKNRKTATSCFSNSPCGSRGSDGGRDRD
jgi:integrase